MSRIIRPRRIDWPTAFWARAESSYADCDLLCRDCFGRGYGVSREDAWERITVEDAACSTCRSSGLLVSARDLPEDPEAIWAADEAGGGWLDWIGHEGGGLLWPPPWSWRISGQRFGILHDVYLGGPNVLAFMFNGSVVVGLLGGVEIAADPAGSIEQFIAPPAEIMLDAARRDATKAETDRWWWD